MAQSADHLAYWEKAETCPTASTVLCRPSRPCQPR
jgi:hypothetical protein